MKMRKILSLALALLMLVSTTFILSACSERDGYVKLSKKQVKVDLTDYGLVYGDSMTGNDYTVTFKERMSDFAAMLNKATGESFVAYSVDRAKTNKGDKEILIGLTNREESKKVYNSIKGDGFAIEVTDKKVVIVGSSNLFTLQAVQYFADKYLSDSEKVNPELSINQKAQAFKMQSVTIADAEESYFSYVHDASLGILPPVYKGVSGSTLANNTYKDYPQVAIDLIVQKMMAQTGLRDKAFKIEKDSDTAEKEVLVGMVARDENKAVLATLADDQYRITVQENQIQVTGWNDVTIKGAVTEYIDLLIEGTAEDKSVSLPIGLSLSGRVDKDWKTDFPKPEGEGIELYNTMDASDNALQYLYMGDGVNATSYKTYCDTLKAAGYSILSENSIEDSLFTTFVNRMEGITLYVAYNAFKHRDEFSAYSYTDSKDETGDKGYYEQDPCFRIVSAPLDSVTLADSTLLTKNPAYDKKTDSMITTMPIYSKAVGLSYVVTLEDGRFIVFDGGGVNDDAATAEHKVLWSTLTMLQERISGKAVSSSNPVHIAAWVLTHAHWDHYYAFVRMADTYGSSGQLKMDYMFANVPTQEGSYAGAAGLNVMSDEL
ncbi:MAG: MBL fold metallo-hydrolase, partial [Clostridia bacterium]|nr:MBL fold metallo-hydrolase [Clostridia bacterium]